MSRAVKIKGWATEMYFVSLGRAEGIIRPGFSQANYEQKKTFCLVSLVWLDFWYIKGKLSRILALYFYYLNRKRRFIRDQ